MPAVTYTFSYAAITVNTMNTLMTVNGGLYGCKNNTAVLQAGSTAVLGTNIAAECTNLANLITSIAADLTANGTMQTISLGAHIINEYPTWYSYSGSQATSLTFTGNSSSKFYIYCTSGEVYFNNCDFILDDDVDTTNIYIICTGNIRFQPSIPKTYFGNILSNTAITSSAATYSNVSLIGTCSVVDAVNLTYMSYMTIQFPDTPCFLKGTKILTDQWYVPVEELKVGDLVIAQGGIRDNKNHVVDNATALPILNIHMHFRKASSATSPIVVTKNAFGINRPFDDLYVSPNHGIVSHKGILTPSKHFINGTTVYQDPTIESLAYYHIELAGHHVVTANGVAVETYRKSSVFEKKC